MKLSSTNRKERDETRRDETRRDETRREPSEALSGASFDGCKYLSKCQNVRSSLRTEFFPWRNLSLRGASPRAVPVQAGKQSPSACVQVLTSLQNPSAFALVVSLGLVALITIFAIAVSRSMIASTRTASDIEQGTEAYFAAEAALEMAVLANKGQEPGFQAEVKCSETNGDVKCYDLAGTEADGINYFDLATGGNGSYASWKVQGRTRCLWDSSDPSLCADDPEYYIPYPGSGTAGDKCDPLIEYPNEDHACNWGKIVYGETAVIPLYAAVNTANSFEVTADSAPYGNNDGILDPSEWDLQEIYIKMRTPCDPARAGVSAEVVLNECDDNERYVLDDLTDDADGDGSEIDTIVLWEITGKDAGGNANYLHAKSDRDSLTGRPELNNTEIHEQALNNATYEILNKNSKGFDKDGNSISLSAFLTTVTKPILTLQVITSLKDNDSSSGAIPYLEYSIKVRGDPDIPPADMYQTLIGEGFSGNFKQSVEMKKSRETGVLKFVIQN